MWNRQRWLLLASLIGIARAVAGTPRLAAPEP